MTATSEAKAKVDALEKTRHRVAVLSEQLADVLVERSAALCAARMYRRVVDEDYRSDEEREAIMMEADGWMLAAGIDVHGG